MLRRRQRGRLRKLRKAEEAKKLAEIEECLKQVESVCEELRAGKVETKEAIQRLLDISERIPE